jgi:glycosyltransferase involved in cell wall biosynthesis
LGSAGTRRIGRRDVKVCYFGAYDPLYSRTRVLLAGLRRHSVEVVHCHASTPLKILRLPLLAKQYLKVWKSVDVIIVGLAGHAYVPLARLLGRLTGKPVVFDAFVSLYDTNVLDRKMAREGSIKGRYYKALDRIAMTLADLVIMDTAQYTEFCSETFGIPASKFRFVRPGADTALFFPQETTRSDNAFIVSFVGTFIPLQGVEYIVDAAELLRHSTNVRFQLVGCGQTYPEVRRRAQRLGLNNVTFVDPLPEASLPAVLAKADVCLGIFGSTGKTQRVVPIKVYDAMAMAKPIVTADTPAARSILTHRETAFLVPTADGASIANAIIELMQDPSLRGRIGQGAFQTFLSIGTPEMIGESLLSICQEAMKGPSWALN